MNAAVVVAGTVAVVALLTLLVTYNGFIHLRQEIRVAWARLDEQLKQRYELVSLLTALCQSTGGELEAKIPAVIAAKNQAAVACNPVELATAEAGLTAAIVPVLVVIENNAGLKANPQINSIYLKLTANLLQIGQACRRYNQKVHELNLSVTSFPQAMTARAVGLRVQPLFDLQR